ncbi:MAG TPA: ATP-binding protein [Streptosporangiaceae bacterium]|nr:ATP-binding protein [Streptosporangiaceae bacterium]
MTQGDCGPDFQVLFESAPVSFLVLDPDGVIVAVSDRYLRDTMTVREQLIGRLVCEVFPEDPGDPNASSGPASLSASLDRVRRHLVPDTMAVLKWDIRRPESAGGGFEVRYWSPINSPVPGPDGRLAYIINLVRDVTEYVRLKEQESDQLELTSRLHQRTQQMEAEILARSRELEDANQALRAADDAKNEFLSRVSHELRTPLNAVLGFGELLSLGDITAEHRDWVTMILGAARHLLALLDDVLDISRIEAGQLSLSVEPVAALEVIADALELVRPLAVSGEVRLDPAAAPGTSQHVLADRQRLHQVLLNLLSNAVKYNQPAGTVTTAIQARPGGRLRINVTDTGQGISQQELGKLFMPFERLDAAVAGIEGSGLGLALSRSLVQAMGGVIGVSSVKGQGSTFWVELPAAEAAAAEHAVEHDTLADSRAYTAAKTMLYVEDVIENVRLVEEILKKRPSVTLIPAPLAATALDLAGQHHPDLILLDVHLPDMTGDEVIRRLRANPVTSAIPVVILSADATRRQIDHLLAAGATAYLTKPIGMRDLLQTIDNAFGEAQPAG